ncbi:MAG TPA: flagellar export protein FliJ [Gammaproteobacteria bacterium]|nr:flagellar export protein FliJ [Gammaproteobacteria bacterium]
MTKAKRLQSLVNLARNDEHHAARALGECQKLLTEQSGRLEELRSYRHEYISRIQQLAKAGMGIETVQRYQQFVQRLDETIGMQATLVERMREECEEKRHTWSTARIKHKSLDKAVTRHCAVETRRRDRREQQRSDEHVTGHYRFTEDENP